MTCQARYIAVVAVALLLLAGGAYTTRYQVVIASPTTPLVVAANGEGTTPAAVIIWDRWLHRVCAARHIGKPNCDWTILDSVSLEAIDARAELAQLEARIRVLTLEHRGDSLESVRDCLAAVIQRRPGVTQADCYGADWREKLGAAAR